jgi:hypothetical protein
MYHAVKANVDTFWKIMCLTTCKIKKNGTITVMSGKIIFLSASV